MKEISFSFFQLLYHLINKIIFKKNYSIHFLENTNKFKKQIFWECGGGYWSYYCGIVKMIKETYSKETLDKIVWIGASAGIFPVIAAQYINNEDEGINYICNKLSTLRQTWYGGIYKFNPLLSDTFYKKYFLKFNKSIIKSSKKVFITILNINILCPLLSNVSFCYDFENCDSFKNTCLTSHGIPFIMGPLDVTLFSHPDPNKWYIKRMDAGVFTLFFGFLFGYKNFMPYGVNLSVKVINPSIFSPYRLDYLWINANNNHIKNLYDLGYIDAINNKEKMDEIILFNK
jgi:hypothetical protein